MSEYLCNYETFQSLYMFLFISNDRVKRDTQYHIEMFFLVKATWLLNVCAAIRKIIVQNIVLSFVDQIKHLS